jgi:hypothetical protein
VVVLIDYYSIIGGKLETKAGGNTQGEKDMTLDELAELESRTGNNTGGFSEVQEPKATVNPPEVKPTEAKEPDWKREKELARTEIGRMQKLKSELDAIQAKMVRDVDMSKRQERMERMLEAFFEAESMSKIADQPFAEENPAQAQRAAKLKESFAKLKEDSATDQINSLLSAKGLDLNDARLSYVKSASSQQERLDRLQGLLPALNTEAPAPAPEKTEPAEDIRAQVRKEILAELGKVDVGGAGTPGRSSFTDYARDFAQGKITRQEYSEAKKRYGLD